MFKKKNQKIYCKKETNINNLEELKKKKEQMKDEKIIGFDWKNLCLSSPIFYLLVRPGVLFPEVCLSLSASCYKAVDNTKWNCS